MNKEHTIPEPYASHLKDLRQQMGQLEAQRDQALGAVYRMERDLVALGKHVQMILALQKKEHNLPDGAMELTPDLRLVSSPDQKINGVAH